MRISPYVTVDEQPLSTTALIARAIIGTTRGSKKKFRHATVIAQKLPNSEPTNAIAVITPRKNARLQSPTRPARRSDAHPGHSQP